MRGCSTWTCSRVARTSFDRLVSLLAGCGSAGHILMPPGVDLRKTTNP
ncbi:hypothetical protein I547_4378 [Mycobacterium kansasii 824]|uniref:Uncharacterized protein n=1 Tax=Mycobacterium kansasii TaxID=1768 RepID=A0A1V3XMZ2_MYCKA|nr:hypothetical protein I547_4378 [Mycobacterium kansasii 824]OOK80594.1 hypothetical protein BZL29_1706 [Mycobacterium kansasii]